MRPRPLPWFYPYALERKKRRGRELHRPVVDASLVSRSASVPVFALVDSGSEHILAAPWLARDIGVDRSTSVESMPLGIGGETVAVQFVNVRVRIHNADGPEEEFLEWEAEVGFLRHWRPPWPIILGQVGFLDRFTVTMHRGARCTAIEACDRFEQRFPRRPSAQ